MSEFEELRDEVENVENIGELDGFMEELVSAELSSSRRETILKLLRDWSNSDESGFDVGLTLSSLEQELEEARERVVKQEAEEEHEEKELTEEERKAASQFLKNENVLELIDNEFGKEIVGEEDTRRIVFLSDISALSPTNVNARLAGPSGGGKSHVLNTVSSFIPEEMFALKNTRVSPKYFEYALQGQKLDGKIIQIQEFEGAEGSEITLRPLLAEDENDKIEVGIVDTVEGQLQNRELILEGIPVFQTASTQMELDEELETRTWRVEIDASEEQTAEILQHISDKAAGRDRVGSDKKELIKNAIRFLMDRPRKVNTYFLDFVSDEFPKSEMRVRRDFDKVRGLIEAHAFLHQYHRPRVKIGAEVHVVATRDDYEAVIDMIRNSFSLTVEDLNSSLKKTLETFNEMADNSGDLDPGFEVEEVAAHMSIGKSSCRKYLNQLAEKGYLDKTEHPSNGSKNYYKEGLAGKDAEINLPGFKQSLHPLDREKVEVFMNDLRGENVEVLPSPAEVENGVEMKTVSQAIDDMLMLEEVTATDIQGIWKCLEMPESDDSSQENELYTGIRLISDENEGPDNGNGDEKDEGDDSSDEEDDTADEDGIDDYNIDDEGDNLLQW